MPAGPALALDPELETRVFALVTRVADNDGLVLPPEPQWVLAADAAKRLGYLSEKSFRLHLTNHGEQWLSSRAQSSEKEWTYTKIRPRERLLLKAIGRETGVDMQEALCLIVQAVYENRDGLMKAARKHGADHPWEALRYLVR